MNANKSRQTITIKQYQVPVHNTYSYHPRKILKTNETVFIRQWKNTAEVKAKLFAQYFVIFL